jgi:hypothetical protein
MRNFIFRAALLPVCRRECNHEFAGSSLTAPDLPQGVKRGNFMITKNRRKVGLGGSAASLLHALCESVRKEPFLYAICMLIHMTADRGGAGCL